MASDDFTAADGTALATHNANWASIGLQGDTDEFDVANFEIQSNQVKSANPLLKAGARYSASTERRLQILFVPAATADSNKFFSVGFCGTSTPGGYRLGIKQETGGVITNLSLYTDDGVTDTFRDAAAFSLSGAQALNMYDDNGEIVVEYGGVERIRWTDTVNLTGGNPYFTTGQYGAANLPSFDNFTDGASAASNVSAISNYYRNMRV